ncbi:MAG: hypothetical protein JXR18_16765 [Neptuniibacter sp.]
MKTVFALLVASFFSTVFASEKADQEKRLICPDDTKQQYWDIVEMQHLLINNGFVIKAGGADGCVGRSTINAVFELMSRYKEDLRTLQQLSIENNHLYRAAATSSTQIRSQASSSTTSSNYSRNTNEDYIVWIITGVILFFVIVAVVLRKFHSNAQRNRNVSTGLITFVVTSFRSTAKLLYEGRYLFIFCAAGISFSLALAVPYLAEALGIYNHNSGYANFVVIVVGLPLIWFVWFVRTYEKEYEAEHKKQELWQTEYTKTLEFLGEDNEIKKIAGLSQIMPYIEGRKWGENRISNIKTFFSIVTKYSRIKVDQYLTEEDALFSGGTNQLLTSIKNKEYDELIDRRNQIASKIALIVEHAFKSDKLTDQLTVIQESFGIEKLPISKSMFRSIMHAYWNKQYGVSNFKSTKEGSQIPIYHHKEYLLNEYLVNYSLDTLPSYSTTRQSHFYSQLTPPELFHEAFEWFKTHSDFSSAFRENQHRGLDLVNDFAELFITCELTQLGIRSFYTQRMKLILKYRSDPVLSSISGVMKSAVNTEKLLNLEQNISLYSVHLAFLDVNKVDFSIFEFHDSVIKFSNCTNLLLGDDQSLHPEIIDCEVDGMHTSNNSRIYSLKRVINGMLPEIYEQALKK